MLQIADVYMFLQISISEQSHVSNINNFIYRWFPDYSDMTINIHIVYVNVIIVHQYNTN